MTVPDQHPTRPVERMPWFHGAVPQEDETSGVGLSLSLHAAIARTHLNPAGLGSRARGGVEVTWLAGCFCVCSSKVTPGRLTSSSAEASPISTWWQSFWDRILVMDDSASAVHRELGSHTPPEAIIKLIC